MVIKYKVERSFIDKNTKETVFVNNIINIDINRMKELNERNIGRVIDIIEDEQEVKNEKLSTDEEVNEKEEIIAPDEDDQKEPTEEIENQEERYTKEKLEAMKVNELKEVAEKIGCELSNATKKEIIQEILEFQK